MRNERWIDTRTRYVLIEFVVYNANCKLGGNFEGPNVPEVSYTIHIVGSLGYQWICFAR